MGQQDGYMLARDQKETNRLNFQHKFLRSTLNDRLIDPSIDVNGITAIADVGTGTGIWLRDVMSEVKAARLVGFDVSPKQFPTEQHSIEYIVHDATQPFPSQFHEKFDLVNIRLVSYVIKESDLSIWVRNISQLIKPGGYLQWYESDCSDVWVSNSVLEAEAVIRQMAAERIAHGLTPAIVTPLIHTLQSLQLESSTNEYNPLTQGGELFRMTKLESVSTANHVSPEVQRHKTEIALRAILMFFRQSIQRQSDLLKSNASSAEKASEGDISSRQAIIDDIESGKGLARCEWDLMYTLIVARKALPRQRKDPWIADCFLKAT